MYHPACDDEATGLVRYVDQQLEAIRAAAVGLTDAQARERPCRSALSIGGLLKHATYVMRNSTARLAGETARPAEIDAESFAAYQSSFALDEDELATDALTAFDDARTAYVAVLAASDPAAPTAEPPAPWFGIFESLPSNTRYFLVHQVEELARHAGHADIIREQIDGMSVPAIVLSQAGAPANDYFQPYVPEPGTLGTS